MAAKPKSISADEHEWDALREKCRKDGRTVSGYIWKLIREDIEKTAKDE